MQDGLLEGRCWRFGDNINTDLMFPTASFRATPEERLKLVFSANRPGWSELVQPGDIIIAGSNFGTGSGRPAATVLCHLEIAAVIATSVNGLFMRNAINAGLPAIDCEIPEDRAPEGSRVKVDVLNGTVTTEDGSVFTGTPIPPELWKIVAAGGVLPTLQKQGYVATEI